jgi:hypothetical protein
MERKSRTKINLPLSSLLVFLDVSPSTLYVGGVELSTTQRLKVQHQRSLFSLAKLDSLSRTVFSTNVLVV